MVEWNATKDEHVIISKIASRAFIDLDQRRVSKMSLSMDVEAVHSNGCKLKLKELLKARDLDFFHDIVGICNNIDRGTGQLKNCFLPRYSQPE